MSAIIGNRKRKQHKKYKSGFLENLFKILESGEYEKIIRWSQDGTRLLICEPESFAKTVIPRYYKHSSITSFVRQFAKTSKAVDECSLAYSNPNFKKGRRDLLEKIHRNKAKIREERRSIHKEQQHEPRIGKLVKVTEDKAISSCIELFHHFGYLNTVTEDDVNSMDEKVRHIMAKYVPYWCDMKDFTTGQTQSSNYEQTFCEFRKDLMKILEFDEIDRE